MRAALTLGKMLTYIEGLNLTPSEIQELKNMLMGLYEDTYSEAYGDGVEDTKDYWEDETEYAKW